MIWLARASLLALLAMLNSSCCEPPRLCLPIHAASSLVDVLGEFEDHFEATHPHIDVLLSFAGSQVLRLQIEEGASAALFFSANSEHMRALESSGKIVRSEVFAHNRLALVVPEDNPAGIERFEDLVKTNALSVGTRQVPIGVYARQVIRAADRHYGAGFEEKVLSAIASEETNVRLVRARVELGQADAGFVYDTDAMSRGLRRIDIPTELNVETPCLMGLTHTARSDSEIEPIAVAFMNLALSAKGQSTLSRHGFERVP